MKILIETLSRPTPEEVSKRIAAMHELHKLNPYYTTRDFRMVLGETDKLIEKYFKLLRNGELTL